MDLALALETVPDSFLSPPFPLPLFPLFPPLALSSLLASSSSSSFLPFSSPLPSHLPSFRATLFSAVPTFHCRLSPVPPLDAPVCRRSYEKHPTSPPHCPVNPSPARISRPISTSRSHHSRAAHTHRTERRLLFRITWVATSCRASSFPFPFPALREA